jgi:hypothetical protein
MRWERVTFNSLPIEREYLSYLRPNLSPLPSLTLKMSYNGRHQMKQDLWIMLLSKVGIQYEILLPASLFTILEFLPSWQLRPRPRFSTEFYNLCSQPILWWSWSNAGTLVRLSALSNSVAWHPQASKYCQATTASEIFLTTRCLSDI